MPFDDETTLADCPDDDLWVYDQETLIEEIVLFRKTLRYLQEECGDDECWMDCKELLSRFLPPSTSDEDQVEDEEEDITPSHKYEAPPKMARRDVFKLFKVVDPEEAG
jgi:hypothetical protein